MLHNTIAQYLLIHTRVYPWIPIRSPLPGNFPRLYTGHYPRCGICLWIVWVTHPGSLPTVILENSLNGQHELHCAVFISLLINSTLKLLHLFYCILHCHILPFLLQKTPLLCVTAQTPHYDRYFKWSSVSWPYLKLWHGTVCKLLLS